VPTSAQGVPQVYRAVRFWNDDRLDNSQGVQTMIAEDLGRVHPHPPAGYPPAGAV
jgi:hypothetical protein